ncbi:hypothetical protein [Sphingomonas guangdongensis]|uniref:hypothetical protein n=1 Tax=Sphingomonas guangdongensis TaxID=1141890 RepID=UPI0011817963|nr:hypothetical protein [Sphingomonas guangdongensis]
MDEAAVEAASARLQRMRDRSSAAASPPVDDGSGHDAAVTTLARNPFALLGVEPSATTAAINDALDERSFEPGADPAILTAARARLMAPRERLASEIGWLPDLPLPTVAATRRALATGDMATLRSVRDKATGISRVNLSVALVEAGATAPDDLTLIVADAQGVAADVLLDRLDDARFKAHGREIERETYYELLGERAREIGLLAAPLFAASVTTRAALTQVLKEQPPAVSGFGATLRDELLRSYGDQIAAVLDGAQGRITATLAAMRAQPEQEVHAGTLLSTLDYWSSLRRPIQIHEAARGLDDPASADIFTHVRELILQHSNEHRQYEIALRLAKALRACFAHVPIRRAALERELPTLVSNATCRRAEQLHFRALANLETFAREVERGCLERGGGTAGAFAALFDDADDLNEEGLTNLFLALRELGVKLHNELEARAASRAVTMWLGGQPAPADIAAKLEQDLQHFGLSWTVPVRPRRVDA